MINYIWYFFIYGFLGWTVEVAFAGVKSKKFVNRGFLAGAICPIYGVGMAGVLYLFSGYMDNLLLLYLGSVVITTLVELLTGFFLEKVFGARWWDYSDMPLNIGGYVCIPFSLIWGVLCVFVLKVVHPIIAKLVGILPYVLSLTLLIILSTLIIVDFIVTVSNVLGLKKRMKALDDIRLQLREFSDNIGENIYEDTEIVVERTQHAKEKIKKQKENMDLKKEELKGKYSELLEHKNILHKRILSAFPNFVPVHFKETFNDLKEKMNKK